MELAESLRPWRAVPVLVDASDRRMPEQGLLFQRKDPIIHYWEQVRLRHGRRLDHELVNFTGAPLSACNWQDAAFGRPSEAIEVTAVQRRAERWRP